jgi:hypothetical protein
MVIETAGLVVCSVCAQRISCRIIQTVDDGRLTFRGVLLTHGVEKGDVYTCAPCTTASPADPFGAKGVPQDYKGIPPHYTRVWCGEKKQWLPLFSTEGNEGAYTYLEQARDSEDLPPGGQWYEVEDRLWQIINVEEYE